MKSDFESSLPETDYFSRTKPASNFQASDPAPTKKRTTLAGERRPLSVYIAGNPGYGKSSLIQRMALQDIRAGHGVCVIDPTSDLVTRLVHWIPKDRVGDTIYFDTDAPISIDFFSYRNAAERQVLTDQLLNLFNLENAPISRPRLQKIIGTLFDANDDPEIKKPENQKYICTFLDIQTFLESPERREEILRFAKHRRAQWPPEVFKKAAEYAPITERMTPFLESPTLKKMFGAKKPELNIWDMMQANKILLVNLQDTPTDLFIGSLIVSKIQQATFGRRYIPEAKRVPYYLYIDECHTVMKFCAPEFGQILTRARKYKLCLTIANQIPEDLPKEIRQKQGTIGTLILFNLDDENSRLFKSRIFPYETLHNLSKFTAVVCTTGEAKLIKTPTFLGPSPASYARVIKKRPVDNEPCNSGTTSHTQSNGNTDTEPAPGGEANVPPHEGKKP